MDRPVHHQRTSCRACGAESLERFLSLGPTPLANSFLAPDQFAAEQFYPLDLYFCRTCWLVQLLDVIDPEVLFRDYIYVTGTSDTMAAHNARYADTVAEMLDLTPADLVIEIASNDGSLLRQFQRHNVRTLGIEPAQNIAAMAAGSGVETLNQFFNSCTARDVRQSCGPARAVIANNVLAHVDETRDFLAGCRCLLGDRGLAVVEVPYLGDMIERLEYDTVYHEHLCYFSATALMRLGDAVGLSVRRFDHQAVHGGSLRMYAGNKKDYGDHAEQPRALVEQERRQGLAHPACYYQFAERVEDNRHSLLDLLNKLRAEGKALAAYGAPAKGNTLLNYTGIDPGLIQYTVDKNPLKVGTYTPGMHIPVLPVSTLLERQPDYVLILAWNFAEEIRRQQQAYRDRGGRFILPIPEPRIV